MSKAAVHLPVVGLGNTLRKDAWWAGPMATFVVFTSFIVYATFRAFEGKFYIPVGTPYLTPFASPYIPIHGLPLLTPAMLILPGPASFRFTCYYYRKAYYRAFAMDPPGCAVGERSPHHYNGETKLLLFQNLHRYTMYVAVLFLVFLWHDAIRALFWSDGVHVGVGTVVMFVNVILLSAYTFGCHALRHLAGGSVDSYSEAPLGKLRYDLWRLLTRLNGKHATWAWFSLFGVALTDAYLRFVASGAIHDLRIF